MGSEDRSFVLLGQQLLDAIVNAYETADEKYALPRRQFLSDSALPPQDDEEGQLSVHLLRFFYTSGSVNNEVQADLNDPSLALTGEYIVQLSRPSPTLQEDEIASGTFPDPDVISEAADVHMTDAATVPNAIVAAFQLGEIGVCHGVSIIDYTSAAASGGLSMGSWTVRASLA